MAMFVALTLAIDLIPVPPVGAGLLRLTALPLILSGFLLGPRAGFWVGAVSDVLQCMVLPKGMYFPGFTITQGLTGAIPALIAGRAAPSFPRYLVGIAVGQAVTKLLLVPAFLVVLAPAPATAAAWEILATRALFTQGLHVPLYAWVAVTVMRALQSARSPVRPSVGAASS